MTKKKTPKASPIKKSRSNTSGRPSAAKREADKRTKKAKAAKSTRKKTTKAKPPKAAKLPKKPYSFRLSAMNPKTPKQLPETAQTKKGLTLKGLLRGTPKLMLNNSSEVVLEKIKKTKTRSGMPAIQATTYSNDPFRPGKVKREHATYIIGAETLKDNSYNEAKPIHRHKKVLVSCDCESYVLGGAEYANAVHGAGRLIYGNGAPPVMTNPSLAPFLCKHLVELARVTIKKDL
jgi:hypothetical protein